MNYKKCFKCGRILPLSYFYVHHKMKDCHLNKCKDCTKKDVHKHYKKISEDETFMNKERTRGREKYKRLGYVSKRSRTMLLTNHGGARNIHRRLSTLGVDLENRECHHWNYNFPLSVFVLSRKAHKLLHKHLVLNIYTGIFSTDSGEEILTLEQAKQVYKNIFKSLGVDDEIKIYNL